MPVQVVVAVMLGMVLMVWAEPPDNNMRAVLPDLVPLIAATCG